MEILPEALAGLDEAKVRAWRTVREAMGGPLEWAQRNWAQQADASKEFQRNMAETQDPDQRARIALAGAQGGGLELAGGPMAAIRGQLAPYQYQVFDRLIAAGKQPAEALAETRRLTNLMSPPQGGGALSP